MNILLCLCIFNLVIICVVSLLIYFDLNNGWNSIIRLIQTGLGQSYVFSINLTNFRTTRMSPNSHISKALPTHLSFRIEKKSFDLFPHLITRKKYLFIVLWCLVWCLYSHNALKNCSILRANIWELPYPILVRQNSD